MDWYAIYGKDMKRENDEEELTFDYQDMDVSELDSIDGKNGWGSGSLEHISTELSPDWY
tara:strand:+ start:576 stop:752 length:177 start_codon:yes stop_codon:yes gene_type:complete